MSKRLRACAIACAAISIPLKQHAQTAPARASETDPASEEVTVLSPFEVTTTKDNGYAATQTLAGTRIRTDLKDVGAAISVITKDFMNDIGAVDAGTLLQYTTNAEVAGTRGTYAGLGNGTTLDESATLRSPQSAQRIRGLSSADNTRDYFVTDIPWDGYNISRIDILRGPNSFLFGLGSPAGIVNASLRNAEFRNMGQVEARYGSYDSVRVSLDENQQLIPGVLAIRVAGLLDDQKYKQEGAFQNQRRGYITGRYDPRLFKGGSARTSIKVKAENGKIDANRPRTLPIYDGITPWWTFMNKLSLATPYTAGSNPRAVSPWISQFPGNVQQPVWVIDGASNQLYNIYAGVVNTGALNANGVPQNASSGIIGMNYAFEQFAINNVAQYAVNNNLPNAGNYRNKSLTDSSIFDFYNTLVDGPTKSEWERWNTVNVDVSQTFLDDRIGLNFTYDDQRYRNGSQSLLGGAPTLTIDILQSQADLTANPNYGRPYVQAGAGSGGSYQSDRKFYRGSLFGELRPDDFFHNELVLKLIGKQRLNGIAAKEKFNNQNRSWQMYANSQSWAGYYAQNSGNTSSIADRAPNAIIYLGASLKNATTPSGAGIPGITAPVTLRSGNVYNFASTWKNNPGVTYSDPWTVPANLQPMFSPTGGANAGGAGDYAGYTQASNPANYVGWNSNFYMNLLAYDNGADQSFFLGDALIATLGWRYDQVRTKDATAKAVSTNRSILDISKQNFSLPADFPANQIKKGHSTSESFVLHLNKVMENTFKKDLLPINIGLTYNHSSNFQVTSIRRDMYGNSLADPTGATREYGAWVSTKDGKFSLRAVKYTTTLTGNDSGLSGIGGQIGGLVQQGLKWRNVFLYQLGAYDLSSADGGSYRNTWTNAFPDEANPAAATDATITAWNNIQKWLDAKGFFKVWGFNPVPTQFLVDRTTYLSNPGAYTPPAGNVYAYSASAPQGFTVTADTVSRGYEFEFTYNPLPNWRIAFNASEATAIRTNFGGPGIDEFMDYMKSQIVNADGTPAPAGQMPNFGGANGIYNNNWTGLYSTYTLLKAQQGAKVPEIRKWRYNVVTNYTINRGMLKNLGFGVAYRWQDKVGIGYPVKADGTFDMNSPYYGPAEDAVDLWTSYEHKINKRINWKIQLNVRNAFAKDGVIPLTVQPDGTYAAVRIQPTQEWFVTNTLSF
jgi:outer membrane receptor protein involved in Fe transport